MKRIARTDQGFLIDPVTLTTIFLAAKAYANHNKAFEEHMDVDDLMWFQILTNTVNELEKDIHEQ